MNNSTDYPLKAFKLFEISTTCSLKWGDPLKLPKNNLRSDERILSSMYDFGFSSALLTSFKSISLFSYLDRDDRSSEASTLPFFDYFMFWTISNRLWPSI